MRDLAVLRQNNELSVARPATCALGSVCIRAQGLLEHRRKWRELATGLLAFVLQGYVAGSLEPLLDRVSV